MSRVKITDLLPGVDYVVQVRALRAGVPSKWSEKFEFTATTNDNLPKVPTGITWEAVGDAFGATWEPVTKDIANEDVKIVSYELEFSNGTITKTRSVVAKTGSTNTFTLTLADNISLFGGTAAPTITFRIRAVSNKDFKSAWSDPLVAGNSIPEAPTNFTATPGMMSIQLSWDAVPEDDIAGYSVWVSDASGFTETGLNLIYTGDATTFLYVTSTYSEQFFHVRAFDTVGQYSDYAEASATPLDPTSVDIAPPDVPAITFGTINTNANGIGAVATITWSQTIPSPDDLAGFWLRYKRSSDTYWSIVPYQKDDRNASIELLYAYTPYDFQIASVDSSANTSAWSTLFTVTPAVNTAPTNPTGLTGTPGKDSITYKWNAVSDPDIKNYEVTFSTSPTFASGNITYLTGTSTTLTVGGLTYGTTYYARVRAVDTGGLASASWSSTNTSTTGTVTVTDGAAPGSSPTPTVLGRLNSLYATWAPVTNNDTVTYEVHLSTTTGFTPSSGTKVFETNATSALISNLPGTSTALSYGTTYYIKLIAKDKDGSAAAGSQGSGTLSKVASTDVTSIGADLIVPGSGFIANLVINTGGSISSSNYSSGTAGWRISPTGAEFNDSGSSIKVDALKAGTIGGSGGAGVINVAAGTSLVFNGGYLKSNTNTGTSISTAVTSGSGFYLGNDGLFIGGGANGGQIKANALISDTLTSTTITLGSGGSITGPGFTISGSGITVSSGTIAAAAITVTSAFGNSVTSASTTIDGGKINTGSIVSTANAVNVITGAALSPTQPAWSINTTGGAQFGNVTVLGRMNVGSSSYGTSSGIQSYNYIAGSQGWKIDGAGNAEFQNGTFRGTIIATSGTFSGNIDASSGTINGATLSGGAVDANTVAGLTVVASNNFGVPNALFGFTGSSNSITIQNTNPPSIRFYYTSINNVTPPLVGVIRSVSSGGIGIADSGNTIRLNVDTGVVNVSGGSTHFTVDALADGASDNVAQGAKYVRATAAGQLNASTSAPSSRKLKKNIKYLRYDTDKILDLRPRVYEYKDDAGRNRTGFIAEEAHELGLNRWVGYEDRKNPDKPTGFMYDDFVAAHQLVLRQHRDEISELKEENKDLKSRLDALEKAVARLTS